jgi:hypothetical protein
MDSVEKISLPGPIIPYEAIDLVGKLEGSFFVILKIADR